MTHDIHKKEPRVSARQTPWVKRFEVTVSVLTALVTILSAIIAWRAAIASDAAGNADFAGIGAALNREETRILTTESAFQQFRAYTTYLRNNAVGEAISAGLASAPEDKQPALREQRTTSWDQTVTDKDFFDSRYVNADGAYDVERQLSEETAEAAQKKDIEPQPYFSLADRLRQKSNLMVGMLIIMASALWFYTLASEIKHSVRYGLAFLGMLCMLVAVFGAIAVEVL
jgi:hypothetical protein